MSSGNILLVMNGMLLWERSMLLMLKQSWQRRFKKYVKEFKNSKLLDSKDVEINLIKQSQLTSNRPAVLFSNFSSLGKDLTNIIIMINEQLGIKCKQHQYSQSSEMIPEIIILHQIWFETCYDSGRFSADSQVFWKHLKNKWLFLKYFPTIVIKHIVWS